jgi:hypothetical protein
MHSKSGSLEVEIFLEQTQFLSIAEGTETVPTDVAVLKSWKKQHGIAWSTIFMVMEDIAAAVWSSERRDDAVGSAGGKLQVIREAQWVGFVQ